MKPSPAVFAIAVLYIAVGLGGFVSHFPRNWQPEDVLIELTEVLAITCGVFCFGARTGRASCRHQLSGDESDSDPPIVPHRDCLGTVPSRYATPVCYSESARIMTTPIAQSFPTSGRMTRD